MQGRHNGPVPISVYQFSTSASGRPEFTQSKARIATSISVVTLLVVISGIVVVQNDVINHGNFRLPTHPVSNRQAPKAAGSNHTAAISISRPEAAGNRSGRTDAHDGQIARSEPEFAKMVRPVPFVSSPPQKQVDAEIEGGVTRTRHKPAQILTRDRDGHSQPTDMEGTDESRVHVERTSPLNPETGNINAPVESFGLVSADSNPPHRASRRIERRKTLLADLSQGHLPDARLSLDDAKWPTVAIDVNPMGSSDTLDKGLTRTSLVADEKASQLMPSQAGKLEPPSAHLGEPTTALRNSHGLDPESEGSISEPEKPASLSGPVLAAQSTSDSIRYAGQSKPTPVPVQSTAPVITATTLDDNTEVSLAPSGGKAYDRSSNPDFRITTVSFEVGHSNLTAGAQLASGIVPLKRIAGSEPHIRLGDLIGLLEHQMDRPLFVWLKSSGSASKYVTLDTLRSAGICVDYDSSSNHVTLSVPDSKRCLAPSL